MPRLSTKDDGAKVAKGGGRELKFSAEGQQLLDRKLNSVREPGARTEAERERLAKETLRQQAGRFLC